MSVLVTGSSGFIGRHLMAALGTQAIPFDLKDGQDIRWDVLPGAVDAIVHLAAQVSSIDSVYDPLGDYSANATGTVRVLEHARRLRIPVIYASSCKVYPAANGGRTPYGASKYVGDVYCQEYRATYGLQVVANRFSTVYGPGQEGSPESGWLSWFVKCARENLVLTLYGDGNQERDPVWIGDVIDLLVRQVRDPARYDGIWDVGSGPRGRVSLRVVIDYLGLLRGRPLDVRQAPARPSDLELFCAADTIPDWAPTVFPYEGIKRLWEGR